MKDQNGYLTRRAYPFEHWIPKAPFIDAVLTMIPEEMRQAFAGNWIVTYFIAQLPGDELDILDPRTQEFLGMAGTTTAAIMEKMGLEFPPDPTKEPEPLPIFT